MKLPKFAVVDALCVLFRSFYASKDITNRKGQNIAGIYGFARELIAIKRRLQPAYMAVAFDTGQKTWRHDLMDQYKANRKKTPPELAHQFAWMRELCVACGICMYEVPGYEADDCIASCAIQYGGQAEIHVVSYDKDLYQLVRDGVYVLLPFKGNRIGVQEVIEKYNIRPEQIRDYLALTGDPIDGVIGMSGIGPKTAASWLNEYGDLDNILANVANLKPHSKGLILQHNLEKLALAKELVSLKSGLNLGDISAASLRSPCSYKLTDFLKQVGLDSLGFDFLDAFCADQPISLRF